MQRRTVIASLGSGIAAFGGGVLLFDKGTESAQAAVSLGELKISDDSVTTSDGNIQDVTATVSGEWSYELPGGSPDKWIVDLRVSDGDAWYVLGEKTGSQRYAQYSSSYEVSGSLIEDGPFEQSFFSAPGPGKQKSVEMPFEVRFRLLNGSGQKLANASIQDTATVTVGQEAINAELYGEVSGEGSVEITK